MARFHITAKGNPGVCTAKEGNCPLGELEEHYNSKDEARVGYEKRMAEAHEVLERLARGENVLLETKAINGEPVITVPEGFEQQDEDLNSEDYYCFVCRRPTNHFAEHDGLVEAGLAEYGKDGSVRRTNNWDDAKAAEIKAAEDAEASRKKQ